MSDGVASLEQYCRWIQLYPWHNPYGFNIVNHEMQCMQLNQQVDSKDSLNRWYSVNNNEEIKNGFTPFNRLLPPDSCIDSEFNQNSLADKLCSLLSEAIKKRICCITSPSCFLSSNMDNEQNLKNIPKAKIAILYSGGIDSAILAALADR